MSLVVLLGALLSILLGFILGFTPVLNENLHWNLWYFLPISGLLFGCLCAVIQFAMCYVFQQPVSRMAVVYLTLATVVGYVAVDYGIYRSLTVEVSGKEGIEDGTHKLSEFFSFGEYMKYRLGWAKADPAAETSGIKSTIAYVVDLAGSALGSIAVLVLCMGKYPYCSRCRRYKRIEKKYEIQFAYDEALLKQIMEPFRELIQSGNCEDMISYCRELSEQHNTVNGNLRIHIDHRVCPSCREVTMLGTVKQRKGKEWHERDDLKFTFTAKPAEQETTT